MKVLMAISHYYSTPEGTERLAHQLARALLARGHDVRVLTMRRGPGPAAVTIEGIPLYRAMRGIERGALFWMLYLLTAMGSLVRFGGWADVLHAHHLYLDALAVPMVGRLLRRPGLAKVACGGTGGDLDRFCGMRFWPMISRIDRPTLERLGALVVRRADAFIAQNHETQREMVALGVPPERCHVVPNGIEVSRFATPRPTQAERKAIRLLCVGRLAEQKGLDVMLRALPAVRAALGPITITILGEGPERGRIEALAAEIGVAADVRCEGVVDDVRSFLSAVHIFVFSSRYEGLPNAVLEAMAACIPVVTTAVQGTVEAIRDGIEGVLVPPNDATALVTALVAVLKDEPLAARLAAEARLRVAKDFSVQTMVDRILRVNRQTLRPIQEPTE